MSQLSLQLIEKEKQEKTGKLDLGNCGLKEIPKELFQLTWLEELFFCNRIWDNKKKTWINSSNSGGKNHISITELPIGFKNLTRLKKLYFGGESVENWRLNRCDILSCLGNLQTLYLRFNQISDISFLENLTSLQTLDLRSNQISNYRFLKNLIGLKSLDLRLNHIRDISFLKRLTGLQTLYLSENPIRDISFLKRLTGLQTLYLSSNNIRDCSFLENLIGLKSLDLSFNPA